MHQVIVKVELSLFMEASIFLQQVVKFLLENGADSKLQTSQNYWATDLARSEAVLNLLNQEEKTSDFYTIDSQGSLPHPQHTEPNYHLQLDRINGLNGSFIQTSSGNKFYDHAFSLQVAQDTKVRLIPQESLVINAKVSHSGEQGFYVQSFPEEYGFPRNVYPFANETEVSKEREVTNSRSSMCNEVVDNNDNVQVKCDYGTWYYQNSSCCQDGSEQMQLKGDAEDGSRVIESANSEDLVQDITKESPSASTCLNDLGGPVARDLDEMHVKNLPAKTHCLAVTSDSEEDAVRPEKLNECLDKAMIEISSYLGTSQKVDMHSVPCNGHESDLDNYYATNDLKNDQNLNGKALPNEFVSVNSLQGSETTETSLNFDNCQKEQLSVGSSLLKRMECKEGETKVSGGEVTSDGASSADQQPNMNFSKVKLRSERKKDSCVSERSGKSVRRKRTSTRSSDTSKCESLQSIKKEECTNHISNTSWRSDLPKYRHSLSAIPLFVPGYEDFLINSENGKKTSKSLSHEVSQCWCKKPCNMLHTVHH